MERKKNVSLRSELPTVFPVTSLYPASNLSFDLPRKIVKRKETLLTACTIPIEHAPNSNVTEHRAASLSKLVNHQIFKFDSEI